MIDTYLLEREQLAMVLVLVDGEIGPTKLDVPAARLDPGQRPPPPGDRHQARQGQGRRSGTSARRSWPPGCGLLPADVVWVSATKNVGIDRLRDLVRLWLA